VQIVSNLSIIALSQLTMFIVLYGRWETYPRKFAKRRRCRNAEYCRKECQSTAWSEGHFWYSPKDRDDDPNASLINRQAFVDTLQLNTPLTFAGGEEGTSLVANPSGPAVGRAGRMLRVHVRERVIAIGSAAAGAEAMHAARSITPSSRSAGLSSLAVSSHESSAIANGSIGMPPVLANRAAAAARQTSTMRNMCTYNSADP
jgi:hypothetical protein